ncbi:DUF2489 domain-containing protein [Aestuariicella hydrocarbonica]|uniref:DUF2489 domain-containing protein n=1 Tax=Pseudomaricurvus hydrocarbonicus TaxID=1470433 RepID=A0A9E5MM27_9GAMM|nr:DUF2489 domain-containing protein [Aestuariicella hydrocarbonica]NHO65315.1 DUF2489 domain-containing protein [Aestuariicella hydrocarbonica]
MSTQSPYLALALIAAASIVFALAAVAVYYRLKLRTMQQHQQAQLEQLKKQGQQQRGRINKSIQIIAQGLLDDQLSLTEGSIRIKVLLDGLAVEEGVQEEFAAFYHLAAATDHIPILEAWKALNTRKKLEFDQQRQQLESDHREFVIDAAQRILGKQF